MSEPLRPSPAPEPALQTAARLLAEGRPAEAAAHLAALTAEAPTYAAAHVLYATALEADGQPAAAVEAWGQAAFLVPRSPLVRRERQRLLDTAPSEAPEPLAQAPAETESVAVPMDIVPVDTEGPLGPDLTLPDEPEIPDEMAPSAEDDEAYEDATPPAPSTADDGLPPDAPAMEADAPDASVPGTPDEATAEPAVLQTMDLSEFDLDFDLGDLDLGDVDLDADDPDADDPDAIEPDAVGWAPDPEPGDPPPVPPADPVADWGDLPPAPGPDLLTPTLPEAAPEPTAAAPEARDAEGWRVLDEEGPAPDDAPPPAAPMSLAVEADLVAPEGDLPPPPPPTFEVADELDALISQLEQAPRIRPDPAYSGPSVRFDESGVDEMVSETLAKIYAAQHRYVEAAVMYEKLAEREPAQADELLRRAAELREKR